MSAVESFAEPVQISISEAAHYKLDQLVSDGYFAEMRDGYRFAVAFALSRRADPPRADGPRKTLYSTSTLDADGVLKLSIDVLNPTRREASYRLAERLADWGVIEIDRLFREEYKTVVDLLPE